MHITWFISMVTTHVFALFVFASSAPSRIIRDGKPIVTQGPGNQSNNSDPTLLYLLVPGILGVVIVVFVSMVICYSLYKKGVKCCITDVCLIWCGLQKYVQPQPSRLQRQQTREGTPIQRQESATESVLNGANCYTYIPLQRNRRPSSHVSTEEGEVFLPVNGSCPGYNGGQNHQFIVNLITEHQRRVAKLNSRDSSERESTTSEDQLPMKLPESCASAGRQSTSSQLNSGGLHETTDVGRINTQHSGGGDETHVRCPSTSSGGGGGNLAGVDHAQFVIRTDEEGKELEAAITKNDRFPPIPEPSQFSGRSETTKPTCLMEKKSSEEAHGDQYKTQERPGNESSKHPSSTPLNKLSISSGVPTTSDSSDININCQRHSRFEKNKMTPSRKKDNHRRARHGTQSVEDHSSGSGYSSSRSSSRETSPLTTPDDPGRGIGAAGINIKRAKNVYVTITSSSDAHFNFDQTSDVQVGNRTSNHWYSPQSRQSRTSEYFESYDNNDDVFQNNEPCEVYV